jgi:hypothetical protein
MKKEYEEVSVLVSKLFSYLPNGALVDFVFFCDQNDYETKVEKNGWAKYRTPFLHGKYPAWCPKPILVPSLIEAEKIELFHAGKLTEGEGVLLSAEYFLRIMSIGDT